MARTQDFLPIENIKDDVILLKDGSVAMVIQTSAVNFDLLSENEQLAIIGSFAALLNSLSFAIQIVIRSERLDISRYLNTLKAAEQQQTNPLLQLMMQKYRQFVSTIIRENEVLDKQFYVVLSVSPLELGVMTKAQTNLQKAITILIPRRDHIMRQLGRIGLKSEQLKTHKLLKLFYKIYNDPVIQSAATQPGVLQAAEQGEKIPEQLKTIQAKDNEQQATESTPNLSAGQPPAPLKKTVTEPQAPVQTQIPEAFAKAQQALNNSTAPRSDGPEGRYQRPVSNRAPFVVEELPDDYGTAR